MTQSLTLSAALEAAFARSAADMHTAMPGRITAVYDDGARVDVQPALKRTRMDELGADVVEAMPVIPGVPVVHPSAGGFALTFPVAVGDTVLLVFAEGSIDRWKARGGVLDPGDPRRHDLSDAVAIVGLRPFADAVTAPDDRVTLGAESGMQVHVTSTQVLLGGAAATDYAALKSDLAALKAAINAAVVVAGDGGASFKATLLTALATWPVSSTTVKVKP